MESMENPGRWAELQSTGTAEILLQTEEIIEYRPERLGMQQILILPDLLGEQKSSWKKFVK